MNDWQTKSSKVVYENRWMVVHEDEVVMPNGKDGIYGYIDSKSDSVYVVPIDKDGNTYIVSQQRYTTKKITWECVAGRAEGQDVETAAKRELLEETGLQAASITPILTSDIANGMTTFQGTFCIATGLERTTDNLDPEDGILAVKKVSLDKVKQMILAGEITCCQSVAAFFTAIAHLDQAKMVQ